MNISVRESEMYLLKRKVELEDGSRAIVEEDGRRGKRDRRKFENLAAARKCWKKSMEDVEEWKEKQAEESNRKKMKGAVGLIN